MLIKGGVLRRWLDEGRTILHTLCLLFYHLTFYFLRLYRRIIDCTLSHSRKNVIRSPQVYFYARAPGDILDTIRRSANVNPMFLHAFEMLQVYSASQSRREFEYPIASVSEDTVSLPSIPYFIAALDSR